MLTFTLRAAVAAALTTSALASSSSHSHFEANAKRLASIWSRDASTQMSGGSNNEGEAHGSIKAPQGSTFTSVNVGSGGEEIAAYWTSKPSDSSASQAFIMIHGKLRDGDSYWTTMDNILSSAVKAGVDGADKDSIIVAPQFFSTKYNSGQYSKNELGWGDVNAWQAGDIATHPSGTKLTSFDALDSLVQEFANSTKYPAMKNVTVVGHGGGAQLNQRYAMVAKDAPSNVHIRYIHGDPSSCAYFTTDRPDSIQGESSLPSKGSCAEYNTWRYGFENFTGTADGLKAPQDYFKQYISRDVISVVGYQDTSANGDTYCMAEMQGGSKRRDRNLAWWQYVNTLARTNEDLDGFPATYKNLPDWSNISDHSIEMQLIVVEDADHDAELVFGSSEGRAALFSSSQMPTGWRPQGWKPAAPVSDTNGQHLNSNGSSSTPGSAAAASSPSLSAASAATSTVIPCITALILSSSLALHYLM